MSLLLKNLLDYYNRDKTLTEANFKIGHLIFNTENRQNISNKQ